MAFLGFVQKDENQELPDDAAPPSRGPTQQPGQPFAEPRSTPPAAEFPSGGYTSNDEHLRDELRRVDQLVRAQTMRWRLTIGEAKPEKYWGMIHVTDAEVQAYLHSTFSLAHELPEILLGAMAPHWRAARSLGREIDSRLNRTANKAPLRLPRLVELFGLSPLERDILLVCLLPELDDRYRRLFGYLLDDCSRTQPTAGLVLQILQPNVPQAAAGRAAFDAGQRLLAHSLLVMDGHARDAEPLPVRPIRLDERIADFLLGSDRPDSRLVGVMAEEKEPLPWADLTLEPKRLHTVRDLAAWQQARAAGGEANLTLFLHGPYGSGRLSAARAICTEMQTPRLVVDVGRALGTAEGWERMVSLSYREAVLRGAAIYWAGCETLLGEDPPGQTPVTTRSHWDRLVSAAEGFRGLTFLASQIAWDPAGRFQTRPFLRLNFPVPSYELRRRLWAAHLAAADLVAGQVPDEAVLAETLASSFLLTQGQIADALATARGVARQREPHGPRLTPDDLYNGCRLQSGRRLITMARRIEPRTELRTDDPFASLVLPPQNRLQLKELWTRIRYLHRVYGELGFEERLSLGKGLVALFAGTSGTGKTMAAELLARARGVDLYKVDLSQVVSKYVGETEKNLSRVFSEAEDSNAIIFFDEADALFGKRGEVKEARDRWANIEVNYLLQRVEEYAGVVILTSNLRQNIDEAFQRRIHVVVEFPFPSAEARLSIMQGMFPPGLQVPEEKDLRELADRFTLSGGSIKNVVLDAAFRAMADAGEGTPAITLRHMAVATAREYQKLGKPISRGEFGQTFYGWLEEDILSG